MKHAKKENKYIRRRGYYEMLIYPMSGGEPASVKIDIADHDYVSQFNWCIRGGGYVGRHDVKTGKTIRLHRVLAKAPDGMVVDHINHDRLDNRRNNLRICTYQENIRNKRSKKTKTGVMGVYLQQSGRYSVSLRTDEKVIFISHFDNFHAAVGVRLFLEKEHYGEFAPQKHMFAEYGL